MLKKAILIFLVLVLIVTMSLPASAALVSYNINDFITSTDVDGANDLMTITVPYQNNSWHTYYQGESLNHDVYGAPIYDIPLVDDENYDYPDDPAIVNGTVAYLPLGNSGAASYFDISTLPSSTVFKLKNIVLIGWSVRSDQRNELSQEFSIQYFDANGNYLGTQKVAKEYAWTVKGVGSVTFDLGDISFSLEKPSGAKYAKFRLLFRSGTLYFSRNFSSLTIDMDSFMFEMSITDADRQLLQENKELLNEVNKQLQEQNKTMSDLKDAIEDAPQKEQNAASDGGNKNIGQVLDVIPNESQGFMNALSSFSQSFSYEGTDAVIPIPAICLPEIPGLIPSFTILESQNFDLGAFVDFFPESLVLLVQSLLTIALIVYCFKELYDTIAYVMTLRKGE